MEDNLDGASGPESTTLADTERRELDRRLALVTQKRDEVTTWDELKEELLSEPSDSEEQKIESTPIIQQRIERFRADLPKMTVENIVRRHITFGDSFVLQEDKYYELKFDISTHFGIHPSEVIVVGSGKLGFSIVPRKRYRPFGDTSDVDVAIISSTLFDKLWLSVFEYRNEVGYWPKETEFKDYLFRGWIRPDKLPPSNKFIIGKDWWEFFRSLTAQGKYGQYKISAGLYRSWQFLEHYQSICVQECMSVMEANK